MGCLVQEPLSLSALLPINYLFQTATPVLAYNSNVAGLYTIFATSLALTNKCWAPAGMHIESRPCSKCILPCRAVHHLLIVSLALNSWLLTFKTCPVHLQAWHNAFHNQQITIQMPTWFTGVYTILTTYLSPLSFNWDFLYINTYPPLLSTSAARK